MDILWKRIFTAEFWAIRPKLCGNSVFPENFHINKLDEITALYAVFPDCGIKPFRSNASIDFNANAVENWKVLE